MSTAQKNSSGEMAIWRRVVDRRQATLSEDAAKALLRLDFAVPDRRRMNELAARNRAGQLSPAESQELDHFIHVGQLLGILQSRARRALRRNGSETAKP